MVHAVECLMQCHLVTMRRTEGISPGFIGKTIRVHDQGVPVPPAYGISIIRRLRIVDWLPAVCPNVAPGMAPLEEFHDLVRSLNELHQRRIELKHDAGIACRLTLEQGVIPLFFGKDWARNTRRLLERK